MELYENQRKAIQISIENDFESGIHYHATGTGKSIIMMNICMEYTKKYPKNNILWICEQKDILEQQFNNSLLKKKNELFYEYSKRYNICNYSVNKQKNWVDSINASKFWNKPLLCIINRSFFTMNENYKKIKVKFDLVLQDECHTSINSSSKRMYEYFLTVLNKEIKCIGFSATPNIEIVPFNRILSSYSIYDAFIDNIIVAPRIVWIKKNEKIDNMDIIKCIRKEMINLQYRKIIIWCGMINYSIDTMNIWKQYFPEMSFYIDNSKCKTSDYEQFYQCKSNAFLFCANKHREGSDIPYLDGCVFIDYVITRSSKVFVQCIGRVLRKDIEGKKQYGLIIDCNAHKVSNICVRINKYLCMNEHLHIFPWNYTNEVYENMEIHSLCMKKEKLEIKREVEKEYTIEDLEKYILRKELLKNKKYQIRYDYECNLLIEKKLIKYLIQAVNILQLTKNIPHVTRGSCGSSLVCFLLGISNVDPIEYNISFERFLTKYRNNLPDIDLDFPYNIRDDVFLKIELHEDYIGKIARISNHIYYKEKSAIRQAIRNVGIRKFISKYDINKVINSCNKTIQNKIKEETKKIQNTFRGYMLHCGGIVYYPNGIPKEHLLDKPTKVNNQIKLNKIDISKEKHFKIDILSSRALAKYEEMCSYVYEQYIEFTDLKYDHKTYEMLCNGDNIGLTLAESPLIRKAFIKIQPKNIYDIAVCLAIIRPAVSSVRYKDFINDSDFIFDDDAITIISRECGISKDEADDIRRMFSKNDKEGIKEFEQKYTSFSQKQMIKNCKKLHQYSFCKSHAISYAQLIYGLAYFKCNYPQIFWNVSIQHFEKSHCMYKKWVYEYNHYLYNDIDLDLDLDLDLDAETSINKCNKINKSKSLSIYAIHRRKKNQLHYKLPIHQQLKILGTWNIKEYNTLSNQTFFPKCHYYFEIETNRHFFNGIIATHRKVGKNLILFIGTNVNEYYEVIINWDKFNINQMIGIKGIGILTNDNQINYKVIDCTHKDSSYKFY